MLTDFKEAEKYKKIIIDLSKRFSDASGLNNYEDLIHEGLIYLSSTIPDLKKKSKGEYKGKKLPRAFVRLVLKRYYIKVIRKLVDTNRLLLERDEDSLKDFVIKADVSILESPELEYISNVYVDEFLAFLQRKTTVYKNVIYKQAYWYVKDLIYTPDEYITILDNLINNGSHRKSFNYVYSVYRGINFKSITVILSLVRKLYLQFERKGR